MAARTNSFNSLGIALDQRNANRLVVQQVQPNSIAANAGLRPGDVITGLGGQRMNNVNMLTRALQGANGNLGLTVMRGNQAQSLTLQGVGTLVIA